MKRLRKLTGLSAREWTTFTPCLESPPSLHRVAYPWRLSGSSRLTLSGARSKGIHFTALAGGHSSHPSTSTRLRFPFCGGGHLQTTTTRVLLVGLGAIGGTHARALEATPSADVVAGVDVDGSRTLEFRGADRPVYPSLREASEVLAVREPDLVVIATPTGTHAAVCEQAARWFPEARLLRVGPAGALCPAV